MSSFIVLPLDPSISCLQDGYPFMGVSLNPHLPLKSISSDTSSKTASSPRNLRKKACSERGSNSNEEGTIGVVRSWNTHTQKTSFVNRNFSPKKIGCQGIDKKVLVICALMEQCGRVKRIQWPRSGIEVAVKEYVTNWAVVFDHVCHVFVTGGCFLLRE